MHCAGAALRHSAAEFCAGEIEMITNDPQEWRFAGQVDVLWLAIESELVCHGLPLCVVVLFTLLRFGVGCRA